MSDLTLGKLDTSVLMAKITSDLNRYPKRSDFDYSGDVTASDFGKVIGKENIRGRSESEGKYHELLRGKVADERTREKLIQYAELMVQKRNILTLEITTSEDLTPFEIQVIGTLPEHVDICSNYWIGKDIDSQSLSKEIIKFKGLLRQYGISDAFDESYTGQKGKIVSIKRVLKNY